MNISWALLENMAKGRCKIPRGCTLDYEFRPSLMWFPDIHAVHEFWKAKNPDKEPGSYWGLDSDVRNKVEREYLESQYKRFTGRRHYDCAWQRFTLTDCNGKSIILQMNSQGHVDQLQKVTRSIELLEIVA
jgi:hypothetical protein